MVVLAVSASGDRVSQKSQPTTTPKQNLHFKHAQSNHPCALCDKAVSRPRDTLQLGPDAIYAEQI